jgi:lipid II:glycine glycyltransferase (peptidoglycan interpeptide bridge formation enzyme)
MIKIEVKKEVDKEEWNSLVASVPEGCIFQTTYFAEYLKHSNRITPFYLIAKDEDGEIVGILLCFKSSLAQDFFLHKHLSNFIIPLAKRLMSIISWHYGPVVLDKGNLLEIINIFLKEVDSLAKKENAYLIKNVTFPIYNRSIDFEMIKICFEENGFTTKKWATFLVDLKQPIDTIWKNLKGGATRTPIRKSLRHGICVRIAKEEDLADYLKILREFRNRAKLGLPPVYPNREMWDIFTENNNLKIFLAEKEQNLLAAVPILIYNGMAIQFALARSDFCYNHRIDANDLLQWKVIKFCNGKGYKVYDLVGVSPNPKSDAEKGIYFFKSKWGGEYVEYYMHSKVYSKWKDDFVNWIKKIAG